MDFGLTALGRITGSVTDAATGAGLPQVSVQIFDAGGVLTTVHQTDASGLFSTTGLPTGTYFARTVNALGYTDGLYGGISCGAGRPVTTGTPIPVTEGSSTGNIAFTLAK